MFIEPLPSIEYTRHNIIIPHMSRSCYWSLSFWSTHQTVICILLRPMVATCLVSLVLRDLTILILLGYNDHGLEIFIEGDAMFLSRASEEVCETIFEIDD